MRIPQIFVPEKSLDHKIEELYEDPKERLDRKTKEHLEDHSFYEAVSSGLKALLRMLNSRTDFPTRILWISDKYQTNRYDYVEKMIDKVIEESGEKPAYDVYNYYDQKFERKDLIIILDKWCTGHSLQVVYVNHEITEELRRDSRENAPLLDRSFIVSI
ncbi:MAG: hypothetical protein Q8N77_04585 [Nanoarchaeota archaeon]|nr:hypothetical protein [Nanoarchaeota archaeon]